ncbi:MAG: cytochrome c5 family protein [Pseudomonadales bacterium]|nr:cytochrome c5 family protein [Pseudomonadales bacterium]
MNKVLGVTAMVVLSAAFAACGAKENNPAPPPEVEAQIVERVTPPGEVVKQGAATPAAGGSARSGEEIYQAKCVTCHGTGAAGAPKLGDKAAWEPRIAKGLDTLHTSAINGFLGMPPKGLCMDCSDDELKASVDYMVDHSK